ncbi:heptosyltransferase II [Planctomycetota bacterium]|nr:heptosyltransferase II [Planctomycetota bacterium]
MVNPARMSDSALAVRLPNWVGDVCMALPALRLLDEHGHSLALFGRGWAADLLSAWPWSVAKVPDGMRAVTAAVRASGASKGLLFTNSFSSALQMRLAGVRATGYGKECRGLLLGRQVLRIDGQHEVEAYWRLAQAALELPFSPPPDRLGLKLTEGHRTAAAAALVSAGVTGPYTVLAPLAVGLADGRPKVWPSFPLLSRMLLDAHETVVVCPGPGEEASCRAATPGATVVAGLGLGAYAAVMDGAKAVIANDSGPMHLAAAMDTPVLGIFGASDPRRTQPWSRRGFAIGEPGAWPSPFQVWQALDRVWAARGIAVGGA